MKDKKSNIINILSVIIAVIGIALLLSGIIFLTYNKLTPTNLAPNQDRTFNLLEKTEDLEETFLEKIPLSVKRLSNQDKLYFASRIISKSSNLSFSKKEMSKVLKEYFGNKIKYTDEDIKSPNNSKILYKYDANKEKYLYKNDDTFSLEYDYTSASIESRKGDYYIITKRYLFKDKHGSKYNLYASITDYKAKINKLGVYTPINDIFDGRIIKNYEKKLPEVKYIFKKEKDNYALKRITITKK